MPKATQLSAFGPAAMRRQPGEGAGEKGRQAPAISRTTAAALPGGQHGTPRMQKLAEATGRTEGLTAGPRFVLAQAPAEGGPEEPVPTCPNEAASAEQNGRGEE